MCPQQISEQIIDSNRTILENTFAFIQTEKFLSYLSENSPPLKAKKNITNRHGKIYKRFYEDDEFSTDHIMALYRIANQD